MKPELLRVDEAYEYRWCEEIPDGDDIKDHEPRHGSIVVLSEVQENGTEFSFARGVFSDGAYGLFYARELFPLD